MNKIIVQFGIVLLLVIFLNGCLEDSLSNTVVIENRGSYSSIQEAINNSYENDTINVHKGTYYETLIINKSVKLMGAGSKKTHIICRECDDNTSAIIFVTADGCTIDGFTLTATDCEKDIPGIRIYASDNIISNNTIINTKQGIYLFNHATASHNTISDNIISNSSTCGIFVSSGSKNNVIKSNIITYSRKGIWLTYASNNVVSANTILFNTNGMFISHGAEYNKAYSNNISHNDEGIHIQGGEYTEVFNNTLFDNVEAINIVICCGIKVDNNEVYNNIIG